MATQIVESPKATQAGLAVTETLARLHEQVAGVVRTDNDGLTKFDRSVFTDPQLFDLEVESLFESNWCYVAHESQLKNPHDFFTTRIGRQPVVITRDANGTLRGFLNACSHRGARVFRERTGHGKVTMCGFHGWCFNTSGELVGVKEQSSGDYPKGFDKTKLGLTPIRIESYRGFIFGSIVSTVCSLADHLGDACKFIDLLVDQSPTGELEVLRGVSRYVYKGNWKLSVEGGIDGYHPYPVHASFIDAITMRMRGKSAVTTEGWDLSKASGEEGGYFCFDNGHGVVWINFANYQIRPGFENYAWMQSQHGEARAKWMVERGRNLLIFPHLHLMDSIGTQIRVSHPLAVDHTLVETWCFAPVGESRAARTARIRQYEDFYNASGIATPDDLAEFTNCQEGYEARSSRWSELSRGIPKLSSEPNAHAQALGITPRLNSLGTDPGSEGIYVGIYEHWQSALLSALDRKRAEQA